MPKPKNILLVMILFLSLVVFPGGNLHAGKQRNFMLVFHLKEYTVKLEDTVNYFFNHVFQKGDQLMVVTPKRFVGFSPGKLAGEKSMLITEILNTLETDISAGMGNYRKTLEEMTQDIQTLSQQYRLDPAEIEDLLSHYQQKQQILLIPGEAIAAQLLKYSQIFRRVRRNGDNHLLMILQKETRPIPDKETMERIRRFAFDNGFKAAAVFTGEQSETAVDLLELEVAFKYARVRFHLLYLQNKGVPTRQGVDYIENSRDIYGIFARIAKATDGIILTSSKPSAFLKRLEPLLSGKVEVEVIDEKME